MSQKRTSLRQMSLTESFSKVKRPSYTFPEPTIVSAVLHIDDSDSELETSLSKCDGKCVYFIGKIC